MGQYDHETPTKEEFLSTVRERINIGMMEQYGNPMMSGLLFLFARVLAPLVYTLFEMVVEPLEQRIQELERRK